MSIPVDVERLAEEAATHGGATYLVTTGDDGRPHLSHVAVSFQGASVRMGGGRTARANAAARPGVALLWPPATVGDYSLIADGEATVDGDDVVVVPTRGVLHRPAPAPDGSDGSCASDCVPLTSPGGTR